MSRAPSHPLTLPLLILVKAMTRFPIWISSSAVRVPGLCVVSPKVISNMEKAVRGLIMGIAD